MGGGCFHHPSAAAKSLAVAFSFLCRKKVTLFFLCLAFNAFIVQCVCVYVSIDRPSSDVIVVKNLRYKGYLYRLFLKNSNGDQNHHQVLFLKVKLAPLFSKC